MILLLLLLVPQFSLIELRLNKSYTWFSNYSEICYSREPTFNLKKLNPGLHHMQIESYFRNCYYLTMLGFKPTVNIYLIPSSVFYKFTDMTKKVLNKSSRPIKISNIILNIGSQIAEFIHEGGFDTPFGELDITEAIGSALGYITDKGFDSEWMEEYLLNPVSVQDNSRIFMLELAEPYVMIHRSTNYYTETKITGQSYILGPEYERD